MAVCPRYLEGMKKLGNQIICTGGLLDDEGKMKGSAGSRCMKACI